MYYLLILFAFMIGCKEQPEDIKKDIVFLTKTRDLVKTELYSLERKLQSKQPLLNEIVLLQNNKEVFKAISEGKKVKYILKVNLSQSDTSLTFSGKLVTCETDVDFEIFTDKDTYDNALVGSSFANVFGTFSHFNMHDFKVKGKRTVVVNLEKPQ